MKGEYVALRSLQNSEGYAVLQALWAQQHSKIVDATRKAGKKGQESAWRYFAGQLEGFEIAITQVERALIDMAKQEEEGTPASETAVEQLLKQIKGEQS